MQKILNIACFPVEIINIICNNLSLLESLNFLATNSFFMAKIHEIEWNYRIIRLPSYKYLPRITQFYQFSKYDLRSCSDENILKNIYYFDYFINCEYIRLGWNNQVSNSILPYFKNCRKIILNSLRITDIGLQNLEKCKYLDISNCCNITGEGFIYLVNVKKLCFNHCYNYDGTGIEYLKNCQSLSLTNCINITNFKNFSLIMNCHTINLTKTKITDIDLQYIGHIKNITLSGCEITGAGFYHLQTCCYLNISGCKNITDAGLQYLKCCRYLNISGCKNITDAGLQYLINCRKIVIKQCPKITNRITYLVDCEIIIYN